MVVYQIRYRKFCSKEHQKKKKAVHQVKTFL